MTTIRNNNILTNKEIVHLIEFDDAHLNEMSKRPECLYAMNKWIHCYLLVSRHKYGF